MKKQTKPTKPTKPRKLTPLQREMVLKLRRGYRIMFGRTAFSQSVNGNASFSFGDMFCPPNSETGPTINTRVVDALTERGLLEEVPREKPLDTSSMESIIRQQSEARESHRLTEKGRTCPI